MTQQCSMKGCSKTSATSWRFGEHTYAHFCAECANKILSSITAQQGFSASALLRNAERVLRRATEEMRAIAEQEFPTGCVVTRDDGVEAIVRGPDVTDPTQAQLLHENGNVWSRPYTSLLRLLDQESWPTWIKERMK